MHADRTMTLGGHFLLVTLCISAAQPLPSTQDERAPALETELNRLVDEVLSQVRNSPSMMTMDPLRFLDQFRAVEHGTYRLTEATATGLSTLYRTGDVSYVRSEDRPEEVIATASLATDTVQVKALLLARTNAGDSSHGKVQGALEPVQVVLQLRIRRGQPPSLLSFNVNSHLHPVAEKYDGKTDDYELMSIVRDALDYGFNFLYGVKVEKMVEGALHKEIERTLSAVVFPTLSEV